MTGSFVPMLSTRLRMTPVMRSSQSFSTLAISACTRSGSFV